MREILIAAVVAAAAGTARAELPNANLPGNSASLPNSNLPGSMPNDNPVTLPNTDTSRAVIQWGAPSVFFPGDASVPLRNPTLPPTASELAMAAERARAVDELQDARRAAADARAEAAAAKEEAADAREDAADARDEAAAARDEAAAAKQEASEAQSGAAQSSAPPGGAAQNSQ